MRINFESKGGFNNVLKWMKDSSKIDMKKIEKIAKDGVEHLADGTPKETGETSSGWRYDIEIEPNSVEVSWKNVAHPESNVNVAKLIELGHGTGTGGYVKPRPYIKRSMAPVWLKVDKEIKGLSR